MRILSIILALGGFAVAIRASWLWYESSKLEVVPLWAELEPGDAMISMAGWIAGFLRHSMDSAELNARAALLTGIAVALSTASGLAGLFVG